MDRRAFIAGAASVVIAPLVAEAQQPGKISRIGFLSPSSPSDPRDRLGALRQGLREMLRADHIIE